MSSTGSWVPFVICKICVRNAPTTPPLPMKTRFHYLGLEAEYSPGDGALFIIYKITTIEHVPAPLLKTRVRGEV